MNHTREVFSISILKLGVYYYRQNIEYKPVDA